MGDRERERLSERGREGGKAGETCETSKPCSSGGLVRSASTSRPLFG